MVKFACNRMRKGEKGQGTLEFALVMMFFLSFVFAIIQFGWVLFSVASLDYSISRAQLDVTKEEAYLHTDHDALVKDVVLESVVGLDPDNLTITDAEITCTVVEPEPQYIDAESHPQDIEYGITQATAKREYINIVGDLTYEVPLLVPFFMLDGYTYTYHIDRTNTVFAQFEVS